MQTTINWLQSILLILASKPCFRDKRIGMLSQNKKHFDMLVPEIAVLDRNGNCWVLADLISCITDRLEDWL